jgi:hypothetical protein
MVRPIAKEDADAKVKDRLSVAIGIEKYSKKDVDVAKNPKYPENPIEGQAAENYNAGAIKDLLEAEANDKA